jgi:hypothetical protein
MEGSERGIGIENDIFAGQIEYEFTHLCHQTGVN